MDSTTNPFRDQLFAWYEQLGFWVYVVTAGLVAWEAWAMYRKGKLNFHYLLDNVSLSYDGPPLPENPVDALDELQRRHFESANNDER